MSENPKSAKSRAINRKKSRRFRKNSINQRLKKNLNNIIKEIYNLGKLTELPPQLYIKALKIEPKDRTMRDLQYIKYFLDHSKLADKFKLDNFKKESLDQIFKPDNFYMILDGKVGVLKPTPKNEEMSGLQYFQHLLYLKKQKEIYILKKTIEKNKEIFDVDFNDIDILNSIVMKILVEDYFSIGIKKTETRTIEEILKLCGFKLEYFGIFFDHERRKDKEYVEKNERIILKNLPNIKKDLVLKYKILTNETTVFQITTFYYESIVELGNNFFFGDTALDKVTTRNATIKTVNDTDFCYLELDYYKSYLRNEKQRLTMKEVNFLVSNFCFQTVNQHHFEKKFLNHFLYEEKYQNDFIIKDNQPAKFVFFIKEGTCDVYINKNVFEIHNLISYLSQLETDPKFNVQNILLTYKNDFFSLKDQMNRIQKTKIFCINNCDFIGLESIFFGLNYLYNVKVTSRNIKYYKLELKYLLEIIQEDANCYYIGKRDCEKKLNILIQRLTDLNQTKMEMIDSKETVNLNHLQIEKELNKSEKQLEFGEENYEKNKLKMSNEYQKKFNLDVHYHSIKKVSTKKVSPKKDLKINILKQKKSNLLPFIPKINNLNTLKTNDIVQVQKSEIFSPGKFGFVKEKNMIRNLQKQFLQEDKLFLTLNPNLTKRMSNILDEKETNIFFYQTHKKRTYDNKFKGLSEKLKKHHTYISSDENLNTYTNINTLTNTITNSNYIINSTRSQMTITSSINNDDDNSYIPKIFKPLKTYNGKFIKEKAVNYKNFKKKMTSEDLWDYRYSKTHEF